MKRSVYTPIGGLSGPVAIATWRQDWRLTVATHTIAFAGTSVEAGATRALVPVAGDSFFAVQGTSAGAGPTAYLLPDKMHLVACYAMGEELAHAQIVAPSLLSVGYPFIRPIDVQSVPASDPNFQVFHDGALSLPSGEPVSIGVDKAGPGRNADAKARIEAVILLWFVQHPQHHQVTHPGAHGAGPSPAGVAPGGLGHTGSGHTHKGHEHTYWLRYKLVPAAANEEIEPQYRWVQFPIEFEQTLPSGTYAVVGHEHVGDKAVAARLIFPGSVHRPATIAEGKLASRTAQGFYEGLFGVLGHFKTISLPYVEVLTAEKAKVAAHEGYLRVARVGDVDHPLGQGATHHAAHTVAAHAPAPSHGAPRLAVGAPAPGVAPAPGTAHAPGAGGAPLYPGGHLPG
jgi:hypothetical protein